MFNALVCPRLPLRKTAGATSPTPGAPANLGNGWSSNPTAVPGVRIKSTVNGSIIGTGGRPIKDVTDNSRKVPVNEVNSFTWTRIAAAPAVTANPNGTFTIGPKVKSVSNKSLRDPVRPANISPTIPLRELLNATASKTTFLIRHKGLVLNSLPGDRVRMGSWWLKTRKEDFNAIAVPT